MQTKSSGRQQQTNTCALYMRLSREDDKGIESTSIETQRKILRDYAHANGFLIYDEYVDDGYTGTNLDRPAFNRMLKDIEAGKINTIITKDISRLGRNSGRISILLDEYFPNHRVRYISVSENYDSAERSSASSILMPVHNFVNELYAADISMKIHAAFDIKMKEGEYIGAFAPYGYRKDPANKNHLLIDEPSAAVVRRIFALARTGHSPSQIAAMLNADHILTPSLYRYQVHPHLDPKSFRGSEYWKGAAVSKLLRSETYLGHTVQGKTFKPSFKSKEVRNLPKNEWIVVHNTHEAIVDEETWQVVRKRMQSRTRKRDKGFVNIFSGIAKCADCGKNMSTTGTRKKGEQANLTCGGYKQGGTSVCTGHTINYNVLYQTVLKVLREQINLTEKEKGQILREMLKEAEKYDDSETKAVQKRLSAVNMKLERLFDDKYSGSIGSEQFEALRKRYTEEKTELEKRLSSVKSLPLTQNSADEATRRHKLFRALIDEYSNLQVLSAELLFSLINRIDVYQGVYIDGVKHQRLDIEFKFRCESKTLEIIPPDK